MKKFVLSIFFLLLPALAITQEQTQQNDDSDRGCCIWKTENGNKCTQANLSYCKTKAKKASIDYTFMKATKCKNVDSCPVQPLTSKKGL